MHATVKLASPGQDEPNGKGEAGGPFASAYRQTSSGGEGERLLGPSVGEQRVGGLVLEGTDEEAQNSLEANTTVSQSDL